ncbi:MAG: tRNA (adenosine(37)-N6)-threonylcarbamoyltransferase complex ATPase subunit type 1 TsaE [Porphyromonas sp.]|nr:tRNA (adenosine(37)-N6)-threonylcarbamoyltransferase complex ATPase subunit type 1 TsaE [Porphyromonas sp.]
MDQKEKVFRYSLEEIPSVAEKLLEQYGEQRVWLLDAPMGAGKTTLIKEVCHQLGVVGDVLSPTFAIVNVYPRFDGEDVYHMDCYRLESEADARRIGADEYLESGAWCFVEWPAVLGNMLPEEALWLRIDVIEEGRRRELSVLEGDVEPFYMQEE